MEEKKRKLTSDPIKNVCKTELKEAATSLEWTISNFSLIAFESKEDFSLDSCKFKSSKNFINTGQWKLQLCKTTSNLTCMDLIIFCLEEWENKFVRASIYVLGSDGNKVNQKSFEEKVKSTAMIIPNFIKFTELHNMLQSDGSLVLHCYLTVIQLNTSYQYYTDMSPSDSFEKSSIITKDFKNLFEEEYLSDILLICGNTTFKSHKSILAARSTVFRTMFTSDFKEKSTDSITIEDMDPIVLRNLLFYIYCGQLPQSPTVPMVMGLFEAAERYNILDLKAFCDEYLKKNIASGNVCEIAQIAHLHKSHQLLDACVAYICANGNNFISGDSDDFFKKIPQCVFQGVLKNIFKSKNIPLITPSFEGKDLFGLPVNRQFPLRAPLFKNIPLATPSFEGKDLFGLPANP